MIFLYVAGLLLLVKPAYAIFGVADVGLFDLASMQLNALDFFDSVILRIVITINLLLAESAAFLAIAGGLLNWASSAPLTLDNPLVSSAFNFVSGIANIFFLLIFIATAFAYILKIETLGMKKALPKLLIAALLVNFSLLFVGIFVDVAQVLFNTVKGAFGDNFLDGALDPLKKSVASIIVWFAAIPAIWLVTALIPYGNVASAVVLSGLVLGDITAGLAGGLFVKGLLLIVINFVLGGIFLLYALLFLARVVVIWLLAISAPLAFACAVLPATQTYWKKWFSMLLSWSFLGVVAFFVLGVGVKLFPVLLDPGKVIDTGAGNAPSLIYHYALLITYLGVSFFVSRSFAATGANYVTTLINEGTKKGLPHFARGLRAAGIGTARRISPLTEKVGEGIQGLRLRGQPLPGAQWTGRRIQMAGKGLSMRVEEKDEAEFQKGLKDVGNKDSFTVFNMVNKELAEKGKLANKMWILGLLNGVRNRGDGDDIEDTLFKDDAPVKLDKKVIGETIKTGLRVGPPGFRPLLKSFLGNMLVNPQEFGFDATRDKATGKWEGKDAQLLTKDLGIERILSKFTAQDFQGDTLAPQNFNMDTEAGRLFMQLMIKERGADFMGQIARRPRKAESIAAMQYIFREGRYTETGLGEDWLLDNNAEDVLRYLESPGARSLGLGRNITRDEIEAKIAQRKVGQTLPQLLEQVVRLEQQRDETTSVRRRTAFQRQIDQINTTVADMRTPLEKLQEEDKRNQDEIERVDKILGKEFKVDDARLKAAAKTRHDQIRQELNRRGIIPPTTPQEQNYTTLLEQSTQQQAQLQNLQQELQQRVQQEQTTTGVFLPIHQQRIQEIRREIQQTAQQLRQTEQQVGSMEIERGQVPEPSAPMPKIQPNMPDPLKRLINQGNTEINTITEWTRELQSNLAGIRESREDLTEIAQTTTKLNEELRELNAQNQAGTLQPELQARLPELQGEIQRLQGRETVLSQQITTYQGEAAKAREGILTSKQKMDGPDGIRERIGAQTEPLQRKYERTQRSQQREQRLEQRQKRRGKR